MFKAVLNDVDLLKVPLIAISEIVDEAIFRLEKDGIKLRAADRAMVAAVDFFLASTAFDSYEIDERRDIGLNIENFVSVLKRASAKDILILELKDSRLDVILQNSSRRKFSLPLLEISQEEVPQIEQLEFNSKITMDSDVLEESIKDAAVVSDSLLLEATPSKFCLIAEGDISKAEVELEKGNESLIELATKDVSRARYPLDYLKKMIKGKKISDNVTLEFSTDYPLKLTFSVLDKCKLSFVLAPRVVEE
jgi:proliferating cell nuclear antigen